MVPLSLSEGRAGVASADAGRQKQRPHWPYLTMATDCASSSDGIGYNFKVLKYPNGSVQVRIYNDPVIIQYQYDSNEKFDECIIDPFDGERISTVEDFDEVTYQKMRCIQSSLARTRRAILDYARRAKWEWFATFTFAPDRSERSNYGRCCRQMRTWLKNVRDRKAPDLEYLAVPELHRDGINWHFHVLMSKTGTLDFKESGHYAKDGKTIFNIPGWRQGYSTATEVQDTYRVQNYIVKYMTKMCHLLTKGEHRYFVSQGLPEVQETSCFIEPGKDLEMIEDLAESLGMEVSFIRHLEGYLNVTYVELLPEHKEG